jgi:hypothetical protein
LAHTLVLERVVLRMRDHILAGDEEFGGVSSGDYRAVLGLVQRSKGAVDPVGRRVHAVASNRSSGADGVEQGLL